MSKERPSPSGTSISPATSADVPAIEAMVKAAYTKYISRIGKPPAPMTADYLALLNTHHVSVLRRASDAVVVGSIVLFIAPETDAVQINNLVVDVTSQGKGYGRVLMDYAEEVARGAAGKVALELFTNVKMWENIGLYAKLGFDEVDRRVEDGYERVYFRKELK